MKKSFFFCAFFFISLLHAEESLSKLLFGYFQNSGSLKELSEKVDKAILNSQSAKISNGMNIQLSTGTIAFNFGSGYCTFTPNASVGIPAARNLTFSASSNMTYDDDSFDTKNTSLGVAVDIYSGVKEQRDIALDKAARALLEAQRNLQSGFVDMETQFYTELKSIYETAQKIVTAQRSLYEHSLEFEQIKAQGYVATSSKYQLKQMEVESDQHDVDIYRRELERKTKVFAHECGVEYAAADAMDFLPAEIPSVDAVDVLAFDKEDYKKIESAVWTNQINSRTRAANKAVAISANAGYTFNNSTNAFMTNQRNFGDTIDVGSSLAWHSTGLKTTAGVSFPIWSGSFSPLFKLSFSIVPQKFRLAAIDKKIEGVDENLELIAIEVAEKDYDTAVLERQTSLEDIEWAAKTYKNSLETYSKIASDTAVWYERGIITQSESRAAQVNKENYRIKTLVNALDLIIYNNKTKALFNRDEELNHDPKLPEKD